MRLSLLLLLLFVAFVAYADDLTPARLRCEYLGNPPAIDVAAPRFSWVLESAERGQRQTAYQIHVATSAESLGKGEADAWDSGEVKSDEQNQIAYAGKPLESFRTYYWTVRTWDRDGKASDWSKPAQWSMGLLQPGDWTAKWIAATPYDPKQPLPLFRREFDVQRPVKRATVYVCGLGFHEVHVNGQRVGDDLLRPDWTNYKKTCVYSAYDVTAQLASGKNAIGVMVGNGQYNVVGGRYVKYLGSFGSPKLLLQLRLEYVDGSSETVVTDAAWKTAPGPIVFSCFYGGEDYDATREIAGWDRPGLDVSAWTDAVVVDGPGGKLTSQSAPPIKVMQTFDNPVVKQPKPGVFVYDLGHNFSGWPKLRAKGPKGAVIKLIPGELLDADGLASQKSSGTPVSFSYTLKGEGEETWTPRFSYYGFRYVQLDGARPAGVEGASKDLPEVVSLTGEFIHSSAERVGTFECSNPLVNRIHALIDAAIDSNLQSVLTDCPHREKLGWLEVSHLLADGLLYNYDAAQFYAKIQQDMSDSITPEGLVPDIAPEYTVFSKGFRDSPEWGSASVINPWNIYLTYGDKRILETHYDVMRRYVDYLGSMAADGIVSHGLGDWCDVGPGSPGESQLTSKGLTATALYYQDLSCLKQAAAVLGKADDARVIAAKADSVRAAFNKAFYHADTQVYDRNSQTANTMPLILGLVEEPNRAGVLANVVKDITANKYHVTAGDVGFSYVVRAFTEADQGDVLYNMLVQTDGPGYVDQLNKGATTLAEAWDANPALSQNHCMLGHVEGWLYRGLGGIRVDAAAPGFKHFVLRPHVPTGLESVKVHYDSVRGRIASAWRHADGRFTWTITIPPNTTATVCVPTGDVKSVTEGGTAIGDAHGLKFVRAEQRYAIYEAESGTYQITSAL